MSDRSKPEEDLFHAALRRMEPETPGAFLDEACAGRPDLRARVAALLAVQAEADRFFAEAERATSLRFDAHQNENHEDPADAAVRRRQPLPDLVRPGGHAHPQH